MRIVLQWELAASPPQRLAIGPARFLALWAIAAQLFVFAGVAAAEPEASIAAEIASLEETPDSSGAVSSDALFSIGSPLGPVEYRTARGVRFGNTGLNIGGFSTFEADRDHGEPLTVALDSLNFLVLYEPIEGFRGFAELEVGDLFEHEAKGATDSSPRFDIERLYGEVSIDDPLAIRFGKFQTPVGRWNLVSAEPFVWTASDPVIIETAFDEHQTGVGVTGNVFPRFGEVEYWLYGQVIDPLDAGDTPAPAKRSIGGRLQLSRSLQDWSIGSSFLATTRGGSWSYLGGLDAQIRVDRLELHAEMVYEGGRIDERDILGGFVQGRFMLLRDFSLITRYEFFDRMDADRQTVHLGDLGVAWQPFSWLILKGTYRFSDRETDDVQRGLTSSISVVF
jgi:hypothetical protein